MLAQIMMDDIKVFSGDEQVRTLTTFIQRSFSLQRVTHKYPWFDDLILSISLGQRRFAMFESVGKTTGSLFSFTKDQAFLSQRRLAKLILHSAPSLAVDEWISTSAALTELDAEFKTLFRPFVICVVKCLLERHDWGVVLRVVLGATLSILNMGTDVNMVNQFYSSGQTFAGTSTVVMILFNLFVQLEIVYMQNARMPRGVLFKDILFVVTYLKPGVDARRSLRGGEQDPFVTVSPTLVMAYAKGTEMALQ